MNGPVSRRHCIGRRRLDGARKGVTMPARAVPAGAVACHPPKENVVTHEIHEQIEHAGHAGGKFAQWIGITVAILGVLMALCSAQVGAARTELIATMVEENGAKARFLTVSNKYRTLQ